MTTTITYGVQMTSLQEMMFSKYISNNGIAMNTKTKDERETLTREWLELQYPEPDDPPKGCTCCETEYCGLA